MEAHSHVFTPLLHLSVLRVLHVHEQLDGLARSSALCVCRYVVRKATAVIDTCMHKEGLVGVTGAGGGSRNVGIYAMEECS